MSSNSPASLLHLQNVTVRFGGLTALSDIQLDVAPGETIGIIGPNGSGKTTLINTVTRLTNAERGATMTFSDENLLTLRPHQLASIGIARTFQSVEMCATDSVLRSVMMGATRRSRATLTGTRGGRLRDRLAERGAQLLEMFGIADWSGAKTREVPYGVGKRAQICRALMSGPRLLLLDEPASGMTATEKRQLGDAIAMMRSEFDLSIVIIEHDVSFLAEGLCDRLIALDSGYLIASGTPEAVRRDAQVISAYLGVDNSLPLPGGLGGPA